MYEYSIKLIKKTQVQKKIHFLFLYPFPYVLVVKNTIYFLSLVSSVQMAAIFVIYGHTLTCRHFGIINFSGWPRPFT